MNRHGTIMTRDEFVACMRQLATHYPTLQHDVIGNRANLTHWFERLQTYDVVYFKDCLGMILGQFNNCPSLDAVCKAMERARRLYLDAIEDRERRQAFASQTRDPLDAFWAQFNTRIMTDGMCRPIIECALERQRRFLLLANHCPALTDDAMSAAETAREEAEALTLRREQPHADAATLQAWREQGLVDGPYELILPMDSEGQFIYPPVPEGAVTP